MLKVGTMKRPGRHVRHYKSSGLTRLVNPFIVKAKRVSRKHFGAGFGRNVDIAQFLANKRRNENQHHEELTGREAFAAEKARQRENIRRLVSLEHSAKRMDHEHEQMARGEKVNTEREYIHNLQNMMMRGRLSQEQFDNEVKRIKTFGFFPQPGKTEREVKDEIIQQWRQQHPEIPKKPTRIEFI